MRTSKQHSKLCTPEQKITLDGLFRDLLNNDNQLNTPRGQGSGGRGYGRRGMQQME